MSESLIDQALEMLEKTHDGDDLSPQHLKLLEHAVNGFLNEFGEQEWEQLVTNVRTGYVVPWFHGIEHLTYSHDGYVYWKGQEVEHYTPGWSYGEEAKTAALELARRCRILEEQNIPVNTTNAIWKWEEVDV